jgi:hypothetical protein
VPHKISKKKILLTPCVFLMMESARAEVFEVRAGLESTTVVSSSYYSEQKSSIQVSGVYSRLISSRWAGYVSYQMNADNSLSATIAGATFQSDDLVQKGGAIRGDGSAEISKTPIWLYRAGFGFGLFKFVDVLRSNNPSLGSRNEQAVRADMYGLKFEASAVRFVSDEWGVMLCGSYAVATAQGLGVNNSAASIGLFRLAN